MQKEIFSKDGSHGVWDWDDLVENSRVLRTVWK